VRFAGEGVAGQLATFEFAVAMDDARDAGRVTSRWSAGWRSRYPGSYRRRGHGNRALAERSSQSSAKFIAVEVTFAVHRAAFDGPGR